MDHPPEFDPGFSTAEMRSIWSLASRVRRMLDVEAALATASADAGWIPAEAASSIVAACATASVGAADLLAEGWAVGTPVIPLVEKVRASLPPEAASFLHAGATSQDIIDTATMLQVRDAFAELSRVLQTLADALALRVERHAEEWVVGRTLLQPAVPIRFAWRVARWLDPVVDHVEALSGAAARLPVQLGGPVGDLSSFGSAGRDIAVQLANVLGLVAPAIPWHTDRRPIAEATALVERIATTVATIAADLLLLSQPEIAEVHLPSGGSSSMPGKKNSITAVRSLAAARACHGVAAIVLGAHPHELERAAGSWHAEWFALPLVFHTAAAALEATTQSILGMTFDGGRAFENLRGATLPDPAASDALVLRVVERYRRLGKRP